eukprot:6434573-Amphidinium_carterae.1
MGPPPRPPAKHCPIPKRLAANEACCFIDLAPVFPDSDGVQRHWSPAESAFFGPRLMRQPTQKQKEVRSIRVACCMGITT